MQPPARGALALAGAGGIPSSGMSDRRSAPLYKQRTWSPDTYREEVWERRKKGNSKRRSKSVTDEDLDELKACIELGFGFDSPVAETDRKLYDTLPALDLYHKVNKQYYDSVSRSSVSSSSECDASDVASPSGIFGLALTDLEYSAFAGDDPRLVKARLRQWAQVVACSVRQC
ncbi:hypothetical protein ACLOJK_013743 [Asimina triloba]